MPVVATSLLALCALAGAGLDVVTRRLPNWLCLVTALAGLAVAVAFGGLGAAMSPALHAVLALLGGMVLFRFGLIGGGDAKFYAACAAWFPLSSALLLLGTVSFAGFVVVLGWLGYRRLAYSRTSEGAFAMVPYGLAVAIGAVALKAVSP